LLRAARKRAGVSQAVLAARAGTTQPAISRIESDHISPTVATLESLLRVLGEELELGADRPDWGFDRSILRDNLARETEDRVRRGLAFSSFVRRNRGAAAR